MARPPKHPVDVKLKIVLSVISGESSAAEAARRHGVSETSIANWKNQFLAGGRHGLEHGDGLGRQFASAGGRVQLHARILAYDRCGSVATDRPHKQLKPAILPIRQAI